jgi:tetratricopeptide (TPR) repeat protein
MNRFLFLSLMLVGFSNAYCQVIVGTPGAQQIFGAISNMGREVVGAVEYQKRKKEQEEREANYLNAVTQGDELFAQGQYNGAITQYNQALSFTENQYVRDQLARCHAELARVEREEYQLLIDKADSLYAQLNYAAAIENYTAAIEKKNLQYPKDKIEQAKANQERWKKVHFSGLLIADTRVDDLSSRAYSNDPYSDFIQSGKYPVIDEFLVYSNYQTLDGIAVPANVRLIIYSEPHFKGKVLVDVVGPAIINNSTKKNESASKELQTREFITPLQVIFPQSVRIWSVSDMKEWIKGSMEISTL